MGFLTSFPPYLSPGSLAAFFRKQKQRRRKGSSASLVLQRGQQQQQEQGEGEESRQEEKEEEEEELISREEEQQQRERGSSKSKRSRRRRITIGSSWLMESYNRHIRNQALGTQRNTTKPPPAKIMNKFELVAINGCRLNNRGMAGRRQELCECCPIARSGHRIFADADFVYIMGGYNPLQHMHHTYTDAWRFNRLTEQWEQCTLADPGKPLPSTLASFSLLQIGHSTGPNEALIYGGTGVPFGVAASDQLHKVRIDRHGKVHIQLQRKESSGGHLAPAQGAIREDMDGNIGIGMHEEEEGQSQIPPRMYGHAMCGRLEPAAREDGGRAAKEVIYLAGGTTGHVYNMDVWRMEREAGARAKTAGPWRCSQLNTQGFEMGRYRLEAVVYGQMLFTFGGGAPDFCAEFNEILAFNLRTNRFQMVPTKADPEFGIPQGRKCHALIQRDNLVFLIGGCRDTRGPQTRLLQMINDVWRIDLDTCAWTRLSTTLPVPVFFHSATLTPDGCIFVFGGCTDAEQPEQDSLTQTRVNRLQRMFLAPPTLKQFAALALVRTLPEHLRQQIAQEGIRLTDTETLIARILAPSTAA